MFCKEIASSHPLYCFIQLLQTGMNKASSVPLSPRIDAKNWSRGGDRTVKFLSEIEVCKAFCYFKP